MSLPADITVKIRLGTGPSFGDPFLLGDPDNGILGTNVLAPNAIQEVNITENVRRISTRHGRDRAFEEYLPSEATIEFYDFTGDWNPNNTSSQYYPEVKPMRQVRVTANYSGTDYNLFAGYISSWDYAWPDQSSDFAIVTIRATDAFRLLQLANINTVTGAANKDLPGERINLILDEIDWPSGQRLIDDGDTELENDPGGFRSALSAIQLIEQSDLGAFYVDHDGKAVYLSRQTLSQQAAGTAYEFDDNGVNIQYQDIDINYDETELANSVTLTRLSGQPQTASDSASIAEYFLRSFNRSGLMMETNTLALTRAGQILNYRKQPRMRIDRFTLDLSSDSNRVVPGLTLEIGDPIVITKNMANGSDLTLRLTVQGHSMDITPDRWVASYTTAFPLSTAFILGSAEFGILGTNTL